MPLAVQVPIMHPPRGCAGKIRYRHIEAAQIALVRLAEAVRDGRAAPAKHRGHPLDVYECDWCGAFHIGHRPSKLGYGPRDG